MKPELPHSPNPYYPLPTPFTVIVRKGDSPLRFLRRLVKTHPRLLEGHAQIVEEIDNDLKMKALVKAERLLESRSFDSHGLLLQTPANYYKHYRARLACLRLCLFALNGMSNEALEFLASLKIEGACGETINQLAKAAKRSHRNPEAGLQMILDIGHRCKLFNTRTATGPRRSLINLNKILQEWAEDLLRQRPEMTGLVLAKAQCLHQLRDNASAGRVVRRLIQTNPLLVDAHSELVIYESSLSRAMRAAHRAQELLDGRMFETAWMPWLRGYEEYYNSNQTGLVVTVMNRLFQEGETDRGLDYLDQLCEFHPSLDYLTDLRRRLARPPMSRKSLLKRLDSWFSGLHFGDA